MEQSAAPVTPALNKGHHFKIFKINTAHSDVPTFLNRARTHLARFSDDSLTFEYLWFYLADDTLCLVVTGTRTSLTVFTEYLYETTEHISSAHMMRQGRGSKVFESLVSSLFAKRVQVKGRHSMARSQV